MPTILFEVAASSLLLTLLIAAAVAGLAALTLLVAFLAALRTTRGRLRGEVFSEFTRCLANVVDVFRLPGHRR